MQNNETRSKTPLVVGALVGVAVIGSLAAWAFGSGKDAETGTPAQETTGEQATPTGDGDGMAKYQDGTYTATGSYVSPAGPEEVGVTLTLAGDTVTGAEFVGKAENPGSVRMQAEFAKGYQQLVVGKSIDQLELGVVNGSSLTPKGFMDAVAKIQVQAARS